MTIPTEPIGSIPRPLRLIEALTERNVVRDLFDGLMLGEEGELAQGVGDAHAPFLSQPGRLD